MVQHRLDIRSILPSSRSRGKAQTCLLLAIASIGLLTVTNVTNPTPAMSMAKAPSQTAATYADNASNGALNLTYASVNASREFQQSSWTANSTTAQTTISSSDAQGETVSMVWRLNQTLMVEAQIVKFDFEFSTQVPSPGASGPNINATVGLTSSDNQGWYAQSRSPVYPNNTVIASVSNIQGQYSNGSLGSSLLYEAQQVSNAKVDSSVGDSTVLFRRDFPKYAAGDGLLHHYTIEIDQQANRTIWIADDNVIATFKLSFVPSNLVFSTSGASTGNLAVATLKDPIQTTIPSLVMSIPGSSFGISTGSTSTTVTTGSADQISSLQHQIDHLNSQLGNLTTQNAQLQTKSAQWFAQWWAVLIWGFLGAAVGGSFFVAGSRLRTNGKKSEGLTRLDSTCPRCGGRMPLDAGFCGECGTVLRRANPTCPECGEQMPPASTFCGDCGTQISVEGPLGQPVPPKNAADEKENSWR